MWLMTRFGFFSVVQKNDDSHLTIRARVKSDLDRLRRHYLPQLSETVGHGGTDYPWRAAAAKKDFAEAMKRIAEDIEYPNFKNEVSLSLAGSGRAHRYAKVWTALADMPEDLPEETGGPLDGLPSEWTLKSTTKVAYRGVVIATDGRILLREVKNHFDGYVWTFPKGRPDPKEAPSDTALREVLEESGAAARILTPIKGEFLGGTTVNRYFLMTVDARELDLNFQSDETAGLRWALPDEVRALFEKTTNQIGRARDLMVLDAALACLPAAPPLERPITRREDWRTLPLSANRKLVLSSGNFQPGICRESSEVICRIRWKKNGSSITKMAHCLFHRSWTGICIYRVVFRPTPDGLAIKSVMVNRRHDQYQNTDDEEDARLVLELIDDLLIRSPDEPVVDRMAVALQAALQPGYLGSPKVISALVDPFFFKVVEKHEGNATFEDVQGENNRITGALTTGEGGYKVMPGWHNEAGLGRAIVRAFCLDPDYYADENLVCILSEGLAGVSLKIDELLKGFKKDTCCAMGEGRSTAVKSPARPRMRRLDGYERCLVSWIDTGQDSLEGSAQRQKASDPIGGPGDQSRN